MPFVYLSFTILLLLISLGLLGSSPTFSDWHGDAPVVSDFDADAPSPVSGFEGMR